MCNLCKSKYKDFLIKHEEASCPFQQNLFCSSCATYGHSLSQCPDPPPVFRRPTIEIKPLSKLAPLLELVNSAESFKAFRGREPSIDALLRHGGLAQRQICTQICSCIISFNKPRISEVFYTSYLMGNNSRQAHKISE